MAVNVVVFVDRGGIEKALRVLKKKHVTEGIKESEQRHKAFMKPSERRNLKRRKALARLKKKLKKSRPDDPDYKPNWTRPYESRTEARSVEQYDAQAVLVE